MQFDWHQWWALYKGEILSFATVVEIIQHWIWYCKFFGCEFISKSIEYSKISQKI